MGSGLTRVDAFQRISSRPVLAEEGVTARDIAEIVGRHLELPVASIAAEKASEHFGTMAMFVGRDGAASSTLTRQWLGWKPTQTGLIADISRRGYFKV